MGKIFKVPALIIWFAAGIWGLILCYEIVVELLGTTFAIISTFMFPVSLTAAPWYEAVANENWLPVLVVYGGGIAALLLYLIGSLIDRDN